MTITLRMANQSFMFSHNTVDKDAASTNQVWLQKVQQLRGYHPDVHSVKC